MILRQFLHAEPVALSYLFGCGGKASAAVVDPLGEVGPYLAAAEACGIRILYVIDTHLHADHLSAGRRLAKAANAEHVLYQGAQAAAPFVAGSDRTVLPLGNVTATIILTPGHSPEPSHR